MLANAPMTTILPVVDLPRAREFYERKLGLVAAGERPDGKFVFTCGGGATLALFPRESPSKADHTAVSFQVDDIGAAIRGLEERGVVFEDYDLPGLKTVNHVCVLGAEKAAWFRDPDGNYLCIHEDIG
ncbi:MAG TPA: VOC family protein [Rhodocyclaceae bacterium]|nr:VOC family protein [Rhodocyclaceae bacterium]